MSDLQRWKAVQWDKSQWIESLAMPTDDGPYVTYSDHVADKTAEREATITEVLNALEALEGFHEMSYDYPAYSMKEMLDAVKALRGKQP